MSDNGGMIRDRLSGSLFRICLAVGGVLVVSLLIGGRLLALPESIDAGVEMTAGASDERGAPIEMGIDSPQPRFAISVEEQRRNFCEPAVNPPNEGEEGFEEWIDELPARLDYLEAVDAMGAEIGYRPTSAYRLTNEEELLCGWHRDLTQALAEGWDGPGLFDGTGATIMYDEPGGEIIAYVYGPAGAVTVEEYEDPEFSQLDYIVDKHGCFLSTLLSECPEDGSVLPSTPPPGFGLLGPEPDEGP